jgi:CRISPR/Cas system CMR-associated protein Cmr1 (group 7 of RAMP superfamily)
MQRDQTARAQLQEDKLRLENEILNLKIFNQKLQSEKQTVDKEYQNLNDRYKALKMAAEESAMLDETELETHRQYFQSLTNNTKEMQVKVQAYKSQFTLVNN